jgi:hypothetical protein
MTRDQGRATIFRLEEQGEETGKPAPASGSRRSGGHYCRLQTGRNHHPERLQSKKTRISASWFLDQIIQGTQSTQPGGRN